MGISQSSILKIKAKVLKNQNALKDPESAIRDPESQDLSEIDQQDLTVAETKYQQWRSEYVRPWNDKPHIEYNKKKEVKQTGAVTSSEAHSVPTQDVISLQLSSSVDWREPDANKNTIPDFSRVGYRQGHVVIPVVPVVKTLEPSKGSMTDDTERIQEALDAVGRLPLKPIGKDGALIRGAVLLKAGAYRVAGALIINASGVVLRGEGQDNNGTVIIATGKIQRDFILVNGMLNSSLGSMKIQHSKAKTEAMSPKNAYRSEKKPDTHTRSNTYIPVGSTVIPVVSTAGYSVGDRIIIVRPCCMQWIKDIGMDKLPSRPDTKKPSVQWTPSSYNFSFERTVVAVDQEKNTLTIDIPMVMCLDPKYPQARISHLAYEHNMISDVGIENLHLISETDHKDPEDENHGWYGVVVDNTIHGWVSNVKTSNFVSGIYAAFWSRFITIQDCAVLDPVSKPEEGGRRYQFNLSGQMGLVKRCFTNKARHDFLSEGRACGPNVFVDSTGVDSNNESGPHERWTMGSLYDNICVNILCVRQRSWMGTGQGWSGVFHVIYNCEAKSSPNQFQDAPGTTNWIIGFKGTLSKPTFKGKRSKMISQSTRANPRSLYWSQLATRMAVEKLKIPVS